MIDDLTPQDNEEEPTQPTENLSPTEPLAPKPEPPKQADFDFERMDKDVEEFRKKIQSINPEIRSGQHDDLTEFNTDFTPIRRRRRQARQNETDVDILENLGAILDRTSPNIDFFLLSILSGIVIGIGYMIDSNAILMFGIFVTPFLGPVVGSILSGIIGDQNNLKQTSGAFVTGIFLTLVSASIVGGISRFFPANNAIQAYYHSHLWWPDFFLIVVGTIILIIRFVQSETRPIIPGLMVAYALYLPIGVAGFGLGSGIPDLWPQGLFVFLVHLSISVLIAFAIFFYLGLRPNNRLGLVFAGALILVSLFILGYFGGIGNILRGDNTPATPLATTAPIPSPTTEPLEAAILAPSQTPQLPTETTLPPTNTPQATTTLGTPQPIDALAITGLPASKTGTIFVRQDTGVVIRVSPSGAAITSINNDRMVEFLDDQPVVNEDGTWLHVRVIPEITDKFTELEGWVLSSYIITGTPSFTP